MQQYMKLMSITKYKITMHIYSIDVPILHALAVHFFTLIITLKARQNDSHLAEDILKCNILYENCGILIYIFLEVTRWLRSLRPYGVTRAQWFKYHVDNLSVSSLFQWFSIDKYMIFVSWNSHFDACTRHYQNRKCTYPSSPLWPYIHVVGT